MVKELTRSKSGAPERGKHVAGVTPHTSRVEGKNKSENEIVCHNTDLRFCFQNVHTFPNSLCLSKVLFLNCTMLVKIFPHGLSQPVKKGAKVLLGNFRPGEASARDARPDLPVLSPRLFPLHTRVAGIPGCGACLCVHQRHTPDALYRGHHCAGWVTAEFTQRPSHMYCTLSLGKELCCTWSQTEHRMCLVE